MRALSFGCRLLFYRYFVFNNAFLIYSLALAFGECVCVCVKFARMFFALPENKVQKSVNHCKLSQFVFVYTNFRFCVMCVKRPQKKHPFECQWCSMKFNRSLIVHNIKKILGAWKWRKYSRFSNRVVVYVFRCFRKQIENLIIISKKSAIT